MNKHWRILATKFDEDFRDTYKMIHQAVQFLAITNKSTLPPQFDDSHTSFTWDYRKNCFASEWINGKRTFRLEFYPSDLCLSLVSHGGDPIDNMHLTGKTKTQIYAHLRQLLAQGGVVVHYFSTDMHYDLPEHRVCKGGKYQVISDQINGEIVKHYSNAHLVLSLIKDKNPSAGPIRCWPHHFDMAIDIPTIHIEGINSSGFSVGFSPASPDLPEPHFYFILKQYNEDESLVKGKLKYGKWLPGNIRGTSLSLSKLVQKKNNQGQVEALFWFLSESYTAILDQVISTGKEGEPIAQKSFH